KNVVEDAETQQYYIGDFLHFRMVNDKSMSNQIHEYNILVNNLKKEEILLPEQFHMKKQVSLEDAIIHIRIEERNKIRDASDKAKEFHSNVSRSNREHSSTYYKVDQS
ncbi:hypothetical protein CICLE_v10023628mg, partial [Citrus x clementina]